VTQEDDFKLPVREEIRKRYAGAAARAGRGHALSAIKLACAECAGPSFEDVRACPDKGCFAWPFRLGKFTGAPKRPQTEKQKAALGRLMEATKGRKASQPPPLASHPGGRG
jgi:hypothetical protein